MKKIIIPFFMLSLTVLIGFGSVSLAGPPQGTPGLAYTTQMESFSGSISLGDEPLLLEFDEIRHISLSLKFETFDSDVDVSMVAHIGGDSLLWHHHTENPLDPFDFVREEIDTDYLDIQVYKHGPGELEGTLYYNITTIYPAIP